MSTVLPEPRPGDTTPPAPAERRHVLALFAVGVLVAVATLGLMLILPHDRYIRWQSLNTEAYARLGWDYERIHYDRTPIDIAFLVTTHTMNGVDADAVQRSVAGAGIRTSEGRCYTATNFSIPSYGRNLH